MIRQFELVEKVKSYDANADEDAINRAYVFAMMAHGSQTRANGDPYFSHPLEVAWILTDLKLGTASIITALLHDTVEDTHVTLDDVEKQFGPEIARLVDGVTKLGKLEFTSEQEKQAENFRKLLIAMSEDLRVLLVKLADRLHNMRTLHFIKSEDKRKRIARETLEIYATLAERIGMRTIKEELQDLAFAQLYPDARQGILNRLEFLRAEGGDTIARIESRLLEILKEHGVTARLSGREKKPYSIWKKMEAKNLTFEQMSDIVAFRLIVDDVSDCYRALGAVHSTYHTVPGRFKDYISTPKPNGYQSLHTTVIGPDNHRIEVQIRTREMHEIGEYGLAAHWMYKQGQQINPQGKQYRWVRELLELLENSEGPEEFLENTRLEMYHDQVFCFTPKGDVMAMPRGATPVDFAYAVHSGVGDRCVGAKVNGRIVPLRHRLMNGDQVEIITSKSQTPSPTWERFVVTAKARSEIRRYMRNQQRTEYVNLGKAILVKTFEQEGESLNEKQLEQALPALNKKAVEDLYAEVGEGLMSRTKVFETVFPGRKKIATSLKKTVSKLRSGKKETGGKVNGKAAIPIKGLIPGMAVHYAGCCHPIPGDRIVGIVTTGKGVTIHTTDCDTLENFADMPERWLEVSWDHASAGDGIYIGRIRAHVLHETGSLATITNAIAKDMGNISNLKIINRSSDSFEILLDIEVKDARHLNTIISDLRGNHAVQSVDRYQY